jgi:hypothetical protein
LNETANHPGPLPHQSRSFLLRRNRQALPREAR